MTLCQALSALPCIHRPDSALILLRWQILQILPGRSILSTLRYISSQSVMSGEIAIPAFDSHMLQSYQEPPAVWNFRKGKSTHALLCMVQPCIQSDGVIACALAASLPYCRPVSSPVTRLAQPALVIADTLCRSLLCCQRLTLRTCLSQDCDSVQECLTHMSFNQFRRDASP